MISYRLTELAYAWNSVGESFFFLDNQCSMKKPQTTTQEETPCVKKLGSTGIPGMIRVLKDLEYKRELMSPFLRPHLLRAVPGIKVTKNISQYFTS